MERTILTLAVKGVFGVPIPTIRIESEDGEKDFMEGSTHLCSTRWEIIVRAIKQ